MAHALNEKFKGCIEIRFDGMMYIIRCIDQAERRELIIKRLKKISEKLICIEELILHTQ